MKTRAHLRAFVTLALTFVPALLAANDPVSQNLAATALGNEGQLYELIAGSYRDLFPGDEAQPADTPVLALDVVQPDGARERLLVPGTAGPEVEGAPSLVFEDASRRLFAVWESKETPTVSRLLLADFIPAGWSEPLEISGEVSPLRDAPQVLVTRDRFTVRNAAGERSTRSRTVIHVVWLEEGPEGKGYYYTPVILEGGQYLGWNPVLALADLDRESPTEPAATEASELLRAPVLAAGQDVHSVVIGYLSPATGRLMTVEARLLPGEVGSLADKIRAVIIEIGARDKGEIEASAKKFREEVIEIGHRLNGGIVEHFADRAYRSVLGLSESDPDQPLEALADDIRAVIIEIGRDLLGGPGRHQSAPKLVQVPPMVLIGQAPEASNPNVTHLVQLQVVMDRPAPPLAEVAARVFVSEDGEGALVGWTAEGKVFYTETSSDASADEGAWTKMKHLTLTEELSAEQAAEILERRVRRR